jgi:hypothetical protein
MPAVLQKIPQALTGRPNRPAYSGDVLAIQAGRTPFSKEEAP